MKQIFNYLLKNFSPMQIFGTISKISNHVKLIGDTADFYRKEALSRGIHKAETVETKNDVQL